MTSKEFNLTLPQRYLFLGKTRSNTDNVNHITLNDAHIRELASTQCVEILAFAFPLFLLLSQTLVTIKKVVRKASPIIAEKKRFLLFFSDGLKLNSLIRIYPSTSGTTPVKVLLDVMPTESADLEKVEQRLYLQPMVQNVITWYPQMHGLKLRSEISISSRQSGHSASS
jgi:hypothetical protein